MNNSKSAAPAATSTSSPKSAPKQSAPKSDDHKYERPSPDKPCLGCGEPWLHSAGFCSDCYNLARKPKKEGLTGDALVAAVKAVLAEPKRKSTPAKPKATKPATAKKSTSEADAPVTVDDALAANAALYSQTAADAPAPEPVAGAPEAQ